MHYYSLEKILLSALFFKKLKVNSHHIKLRALYNQSYCMSSAHSPIFLSLHLRHRSFSNPSAALYVTAHSPTIPLLHLRHSSFSNLSVASPTSQLILQPIFRISYVTGSSLTSPCEAPMVPIVYDTIQSH